MFEADSQLKLLPSSILDIYKVFEHIDMLSISVLSWVELRGVSSNSPHNSIFLAASIFRTAVDILDLVANGIAYPRLLFVLIVLYH